MYQNGRLSPNVAPSNYKIIIDPNFNNFTFEAYEEITINFDKYENKSFSIHSINLKIKKILLDGNIVKFDEDINNELLIIHNSEQFNTSQHKLKIRFSGIIGDDMKGFYRSIYTDNNTKNISGVTQFEATDARRCFVCFDEPNFKSTFDLSILSEQNKTVLSNAEIKNEHVLKNGKKVTTFQTSPLMSSYLLAFAIGDFEYVEKVSKHNLRIRMYCSINNKDKLNFALNVTSSALDWFENWFGIKYPINKLDSIAINDFSSGAMENWGLITYRPELLYVTKDTTLSDKQQVVITICHELAHQWFGNIVTMSWWDYLWLNESMATYFGWLVCDILFPEWNIWNKFMDTEYISAFKLDGLESSHPIEAHIENSKDINQIFDGISYSKGSCVVRFLINYLGDDIFRQGMQHYTKTFAWKNANSDDLWNSFDYIMKNDTNKSIKNIMDSWVKQTGYPIVTLQQVNINGNNTFKLKQERFLTSGSNNDKTKWKIPVKIYADGNEYDIDLYDESIIVNIDNVKDFVINPNRTGFYRVKYDVITFDFKSLSRQMQKQILCDNFALCASGYQGFCDTFKMISELDLNVLQDYELWSTVISNLLSVRHLLTKHEKIKSCVEGYIEKYVVPSAKSLLNVIGLHDKLNEPINNTDLRPLLMDFLAVMKDNDIIEHAKTCFHNNEYKYILQIVGKHASHDEHNKLIDLFKTESDKNPQLKDQLLEAISCTCDSYLIDNIINDFLIKHIRNQDLWHMIFNLIINEHATDKMWHYLTNNWDKIMEIYEAGSSGLSNTIKVIPRGFFTERELTMYMNFFANPPNGTNMVVNQSIESLKNKINSINRILEDKQFLNYLKQV